MHGLEFAEGKLWLTSLHLQKLSLVDPKDFHLIHQIPVHLGRAHGLAWDRGAIWCMHSTDRIIHKLSTKDGRQALIAAGDSRLYANEGRAYTPKEGLKQAQVSTTLGYLITPRTTVIGFAMGSRLGSEAADSPLARKRNSLVAGMGLAFGI